MKRHPLSGWSLSRLRLVLAGFFLTLAIPTAILVAYAYSQLKWEAFHRERVLAEELVKRIDRRFNEVIAIENARPFTDYAFLNVTGTAQSNLLQRSPLSRYPVDSAIPGAIGYFQIDPTGRFSTPLLPVDVAARNDEYAIATPELDARIALRDMMLQVLSTNQLIADKTLERANQGRAGAGGDEAHPDVIVGGTNSTDGSSDDRLAETTKSYAPQAAFEKLKREGPPAKSSEPELKQRLGRLDELKLSDRFEQKAAASSMVTKSVAKQAMQPLRKEQNILPERRVMAQEADQTAGKTGSVPINMFESEIDAFNFSMLGSGHFLLYRKVWKDGQRLIQGILLESTAFIEGMVRPIFYEAAASRSSDLTLAYEGNILSVLGSQSTRTYAARPAEVKGFLLLEGRLAEPFTGINVVFSAIQLPAGPGGTVVNWLAFILLLVLCGGFVLMYRLGVRQIILARQQQDFISAVSHELKTPLTSIRMYGEMLMQGWMDEAKRKDYYAFIHSESERLTRLINNVLQMARMTRNELHLDVKPYTALQLTDIVRSKVSSQIERAGFELNLSCQSGSEGAVTEVDIDSFIQIIINLVDNAVKFSAKAAIKQIDLTCQRLSNGKLQWRIRDYGPGIPKNQMRKIFQLFYRSESELTRETLGTGIGLALVTELTQAMQGAIDVVSQSPGAEFQVSFPIREG
jgi:signal transduction histidine kinase